MNALPQHGIFVLIIASVAAAQSPAKIQVSAQVETSKPIYLGETFGYHIIIDGDDRPAQVDVTPLAKFNPQSAGNRDVSQTSISIINGQTTRTVVKRYIMSYALTADSAGTMQLPPVTVNIDGKTYLTNPVTVNVLKPGTTDALDLEVTLSEQRCYAGQPIIMTVNLYVLSDIGNFHFNIPVLGSSSLFDFENPDIIEPDAQKYRLSNAIQEPVFVTRRQVRHNGKDAVLVLFGKVLIPKRPGAIEIQTTSVSADVVVGRTRNFFGYQPKYQRFMVSSKPITLTVLPLPQTAKPSEFYGLVGRYTIEASAEPTQVSVGEPITLTIRIGGSTYLKPVLWPQLEKVQQFTDNFKIPPEKSPPTIDKGCKVFTQTLRANNDKVTEIPPIPLAFFDPSKGRYDIVKTNPIKLTVAPTKLLTAVDMEGSDFTPANREVEAIRKGLSANYESFDALQSVSFNPITAALSFAYAPLWLAPLALLIFTSLLRLFTNTSPEKLALKRKNSACARAVRHIRKITSAHQDKRNLLVEGMKQYLGERFDRTPASLTAQDCCEIVTSAANAPELAARYAEIIADAESARYGSFASNVDDKTISEAIDLIRTIERKCRK